MNKLHILTPLILAPLILGGCDTFRNTFGLDHYSPNEWDAKPNPGLIIPPDFESRPKLPPPTPGAPNPHGESESVKAQKTVLGEDTTTDSPALSKSSEKDLLVKASENQSATPDIRNTVDKEAEEDGSVSGKIISKIQSWKKEAADNLGLANKDESDSEENDNTKGESSTN